MRPREIPKPSKSHWLLRRLVTLGLSGLASFGILQGCAASKPQTEVIPEIQRVYPNLPAQSCADEPKVPDAVATDVELAQYLEKVRLAGADCRRVVKATKAVQDSWPK